MSSTIKTAAIGVEPIVSKPGLGEITNLHDRIPNKDVGIRFSKPQNKPWFLHRRYGREKKVQGNKKVRQVVEWGIVYVLSATPTSDNYMVGSVGFEPTPYLPKR